MKVESNQCGRQQYSQQWSAPLANWTKVNVDEAYLPGGDRVGTGCVMRDDKGNFIGARCNTVTGGQSAKEAKVLSLRDAITWTIGRGRSRCIFESDAKTVVDAIQGFSGQSLFHMILEDCRELLTHFEEVLVVFVPRSANSVAHAIAQVTHSMSGLREWYDTAHNFLICNLEMNLI